MMNENDRDQGYVAKGFADGTFAMQGKSPEEAPYPAKYALGNIVRLHEPYLAGNNPWHDIAGCRRSFLMCKCGLEFVALREYNEHLKENGFKWGIIVEHVSRNWRGEPKVSLHLYDDEGRLYMGPNHIPVYVDFCASEFEVWKIATETGYLPVGLGR